MTCELSSSSGLIEVQHDATSGHSHHMCYINEQNDCVCECTGNHDPNAETQLQCTAGRTLDTWDTPAEWQAGEFDADTGKTTYWYWWKYSYQRLGYCTTISWAADYHFYYCNGADGDHGDSSCNLAPFDNKGSGVGYFPRHGGSFCTWQSETKHITSEEAGTKHGIRGLNVNLRWRELNDKQPSDYLEVEIKSCQNEAMTHHCTAWTRAHYHADDSPQGWVWMNDEDDSHLDIDTKDLYYQVRVRIDADYKGWGNGYALDKLDVKVQDCEHNEQL
jgi:hypothetical protein